MTSLSMPAFMILCSSVVTFGQSINIAIGPEEQQPSSSYGAAGLAGYWNALPAPHGSTTFNLKQLDGSVTNVRVWQYGGTELRSTDDPGTTGDDQTLMDHCLVTYTTPLETCLFFYDLQDGDYEVLIYAMMPAAPGIVSYTSTNEQTGYPHFIVGGAWPGQHAEGVTYSRHIAHVGTSIPGLLRVHSGIVPGQDPGLGSAFNGIQIRQLPAKHTGDMNCDGAVNGLDIGLFAAALSDSAAYHAGQPTCRIDNGDFDGDEAATVTDLPGFVALLLGM